MTLLHKAPSNEHAIYEIHAQLVNHTPPTPVAIEGATSTFAFLRTSTASGVQGMFEPKRDQRIRRNPSTRIMKVLER